MDEDPQYPDDESIEEEPFAAEQDDELERILQQPIPIAFPEPSTNEEPNRKRQLPDINPPRLGLMPPSKPRLGGSSPQETQPKAQKRSSQKNVEREASRISSIESLHKRNRPIRYFIMKCTTHKNLKIALEKNIWATQDHNEKKLNAAYQVHSDCLLSL